MNDTVPHEENPKSNDNGIRKQKIKPFCKGHGNQIHPCRKPQASPYAIGYFMLYKVAPFIVCKQNYRHQNAH